MVLQAGYSPGWAGETAGGTWTNLPPHQGVLI